MTLRSLAALLLAGSARAAFWTATTNYAIVPTTDVYTYTDDFYSTTQTVTDVYTSYIYIAEDASLDPESAYSTSTFEDSYSDLELVILYYDGESIPSDAIATTTEYDYDASTTYTYYVQEITYTAPSSCETQFEVATETTVNIPPEVTNQITPTSMFTTTDSYYNDVTVIAYIESDAAPMTTDYDYDYIYDYVQSCINPTETSSFDDWYGDDDDDDLNDANLGSLGSGNGGDETGTSDNSNSTITYDCNAFNNCSSMAAWAIALAAVLPAIFLLGFLESYFWFRRMMMGRPALRLGTCCWILLLVPILCFTRKVPARETADQEALREKWRKTSVSKAVDLWISLGFRLRYPVEVLGVHAKYNNPVIGPDGKALPDTGYIPQPPPKGYVYYVPEAANGAAGAAGAARGAVGKHRSSRHPEMAMAAAPGQPQHPPQAHGQRRHRQSRSQRQPASAMPSDPQAGHLSLPPQIPTPNLPSPIPEPSAPVDEREAPAAAEPTEQPRPVSPEQTTDHPPAPQHDPPSPPLPPRPVQQPDSTEAGPSTERREA